LALALFACQRENPAFDPAVGGSDGGSEDNGEASTTQTSTTQTSTTQTGDGDGDSGDGDGEAGDGDGDASTDGPDTGMETVENDMAVEACSVETHEGLWPRFGAPSQFGGQCAPEIGTHVRVGASFGAHWLAIPCPLGCYQPCDLQKQHVIGADGLPDGLATLIPPIAFNPNMQWIGCYYVEAVALTKQTDDACIYASLSVHTDEGPNTAMLFNANRDSWGLTPSAATHYSEWTPEVIDTNMSCECDGLEIECCPGGTVVAKQFKLGVPVPIGETGNVNIDGSPFTFYAAQAQDGTDCEIGPETSWALWAE
jgi:hypothetical protein